MIAHNVQTFYAFRWNQIQQLTQVGFASYCLPSLALGYVFLVVPESVILSTCLFKHVEGGSHNLKWLWKALSCPKHGVW